MARPTLGSSPTLRLHMRISEDDVRVLDDWRFANRMQNRSEAARRLFQKGMEADTLRAENERLRAALKAILGAETHLLHCGYDDGPGGGNYVYKDVIRTDDEAFALARTALSEAQP